MSIMSISIMSILISIVNVISKYLFDDVCDIREDSLCDIMCDITI